VTEYLTQLDILHKTCERYKEYLTQLDILHKTRERYKDTGDERQAENVAIMLLTL